jgi:hypothetical protein
MAAGKVESTKSGNWGSFGGSGHMHGWSGTGKQEPGQTAQEGTGSKRGIAPQAGGTGHGYSSGTTNKDYAGTQMPGCSAATKQGGNSKFAEGGSTHMHGNTGSRKAIGGQSSQ